MPTTSTGRIVYDRKPHLFRYRDVLRIIRKVEITGTEREKVAEALQAVAAAQAAFSDYFSAIRTLVPEVRSTLALRATLILLGELQSLASLLTERAGNRIQQLVNFIADALAGRR